VILITANELIENNKDASIEDKKELIEDWYRSQSEPPSRSDLQLLADWLLEAELKDVSRSKVQKSEYPILSKPQLERRYREIAFDMEIVDLFNLKKSHNLSTRRKH
jgi:hypothetical protein